MKKVTLKRDENASACFCGYSLINSADCGKEWEKETYLGCSKCKTPARENAKFCQGCGGGFEEAPAPPRVGFFRRVFGLNRA